MLYLRREDVDIVRGRMLVENNKHRTRRKRWLQIPREIRSDVAWFLEHSTGEYPFKVCKPDTLSAWIKTWLGGAGCGDRSCHSLRHTFITLAGEQGIELWRIQRHINHSSITVTEGYFHANADDGREISIGLSL
ncbi:tyrosine-type recombinase/integrase [Candidatus Latescibacterota bacterium]